MAATILKIGGTFVTDPSKMTVNIMDISNAERNANGTMMIDRVTTKRKISLEWPHLENAPMSAILTAVSPVFFSVEYPDPQLGTRTTKTFYVGDRTSPVYNLSSGMTPWEGLKLDLVEK